MSKNKDINQLVFHSNNSSESSNNSKQIILPNTENVSSSGHKNISKITNEFAIMRNINHPNILKIQDMPYNDEKHPITSYSNSFTNLKRSIQSFSNVQRVYSIFQLAEGMKYIHSCKIMHVNLNPSSIFISDENIVKISDFKNAQKMTPENQIGQTDDVYSFGELVYFILSGSEINKSAKEKVMKSFTLLARQLIESCFDADLEDRTTFEIICEVLEQNKFNLISLSQQELEEVLNLIDQYKKQIAPCSK